MPPRSTNAPKLTTDETTPLRTSPGLRLVRNSSRCSFWVSSRYARRRQHDVVAVLVELDDLALEHACRRTGCRSRTRRRSTSDAGRKPRRPMSRIRPPLTTSMTGPETTPSFFLDLLDRAPGPLVLRPLLGQDQAAVLVLLLEDEGLDLLAERHDLVRVDVVADRQLLGRDDALGLVADVEQHLVACRS